MKKADADPMKVLIALIILLIVAVILIVLYNSWFGDAKKTGDGAIDLTKLDCDKDGLIDIFDDEVCDIDSSIKGCTTDRKKGCD